METFVSLWPRLTWLFTAAIVVIVPFVVNKKQWAIPAQITLLVIQCICLIIYFNFK